MEEVASLIYLGLNALSAAFALAAAYFARLVNKHVDEHNKKHRELAESLAVALAAARALAAVKKGGKEAQGIIEDPAQPPLIPDEEAHPLEISPPEPVEGSEEADEPRRGRRRRTGTQSAADRKNALRIAALAARGR